MKAVIALVVLMLAVAVAAAEEKRVTLPPDDAYARLKPGPGSDVTQAQCQFCHSTDYIVMQPRGDARQWDAVVNKMRKVFGAPISDADAKTIIEYLTAAYGK